MAPPEAMSEDRLKNAHSDIAFLQREHKQVLQQLHIEIEALQQKCSGNPKFRIYSVDSTLP